MKIKCVILISLCLIILFSQSVNAEDTSWKKYLRDFLMNNFPSLFDEATIRKNKSLIEECFESWDSAKYIYDYKPNIDDLPIDVIIDSEVHGFDALFPSGMYYDLNNDGIPEVIISYYSPFTIGGGGGSNIYTLNGDKYEQIYSGFDNYKWVLLFTNPQNKLVMFERNGHEGLLAIYFVEIINGELILSDYIDSNGNDMYEGYKYNNLGGTGVNIWSDGINIIESDNLIHLPEFDCSDVLDSIKHGMPINPKTSDNSIIFAAVLSMTCFVALAKLKRLKRIKLHILLY